MIVFDLRCAEAGHVFEGWFGSSNDFDDQRRRGFLVCPICGTTEVDKAAMAPRLGGQAEIEAVTPDRPVGLTTGGPEPARVKKLLAELAKAQTEMLAGSHYVGPRFAAEARAIHDGNAEERPIHGQASIREARELIDEGIPVAPLAMPLREPNTDN